MPPSKAQVWFLAARPKTLPAAVSPVLIGTALAWTDGGFYAPAALAACIGALLIQIGTNLANDYFDHQKGTDTEERLGPMRVTQAGLVTPSATRMATIIVFILALLVGMYLVWRGGWPIVIIGLLSIIFGIMYTGGPYPLGYTGLADLFVLVFFGPVAVGGTYYVQTLTITNTAIIAGLAPGFLSVALLTVNNLRDIDGDRKANKKTLAVRFGRSFAIAEYISCLALTCLVPVVLVVKLDGGPYALISSLIFLPALPTVRDVCKTSGEKLNDTLAATGRLLLLYSLIFCVTWII